MAKLTIDIISQEKKLKSLEADSLTAPASEGELTILPGHLPLFSRLGTGRLIYRSNGEEELFAVTGGFLNVEPNNRVTIIVDLLSAEREISLEKAEAARKAAQEQLREGELSREEMIAAEASLRQAMLEIQIAQSSRRRKI